MVGGAHAHAVYTYIISEMFLILAYTKVHSKFIWVIAYI